MNCGDEDALNEQVRYPKSRRWLQFYVDLFMTNCAQHCKEVSVTVVSDPMRSNGCNWRLSVHTPAEKSEHELPCLQSIQSDLQLLFAVFDMESESEEASSSLRLRRA